MHNDVQLTLFLVSWESIQGRRLPPPDVFSSWEKFGELSTYQTCLAPQDVGNLWSVRRGCKGAKNVRGNVIG